MTSWLRAQKKSDLVDIAETVGLKNVATLKKSDLESALDEYLTENASHLSSDQRLAPYFNIRSKTIGSPVKREASASTSEVKVPKRRQTKAAAEESAAPAASGDDDESAGRSSALIRTPGRALSLAASRIALPASPADVAQAVDRSALAVRERVVSIYADSGITEVTQATRESLSTVYAIALLVSAFEWFNLRAEVLPARYAFSIPAIRFLGTSDYAISLPDVFLLLTTSFWTPVTLYFLISIAIPSFFGYFFNLSAASGSHHTGRGRSRPFSNAEYAVDPLTFSVAKAILVYVVQAQGVSFCGWVDQLAVARINSALYGGWQGAITGAAVTGLVSLYDAVLRK
ncbi:hypothetical protein SEUCBS139899_005283 [Sporothrix eucalyptigena]|uniref:Rho termination factor N-terminal domain-containing protein n=1 Tax=Sporothrix eucalyptigena TaxID=1812306 RepID=A0ABP0BQN6_9PEZI